MRATGSTLALALLAGCAVTSGVSKTGPQAYTVTTSASPGRGGVPAAKRAAYIEANAECAKAGGDIAVRREQASPPTWTEGMAIVTLDFECQPRASK